MARHHLQGQLRDIAAANGWIGRAERLLESLNPGPLHGWVWVARDYRMTGSGCRRGAGGGRTRFELGRALIDSEPYAALDHARRALAVFEDLGASLDTDRVAAFLRSHGIIPRTGPKRASTLTMREREVLRLLGAGSNPEIAERLHVSRKTAPHHVSNILTKLGVRNRAEAAAHAAAVLSEADASPSSRT